MSDIESITLSRERAMVPFARPPAGGDPVDGATHPTSHILLASTPTRWRGGNAATRNPPGCT